MPGLVHVETTINGDTVNFLCEPRQSLLECLRDVIGMTGTKEGCNDGNCGACTVMFDGRMVTSCLVLAVEAQGKEITTIEGIATAEGLHPVQQAFLENASLQCGIAGSGARRRRAENSPLVGRQPLSLHWVRQDHPRRAGRRAKDEGLRGYVRSHCEFSCPGGAPPTDENGFPSAHGSTGSPRAGVLPFVLRLSKGELAIYRAALRLRSG